ncbi:MAG: diaminopimelate epimerase [Blautia sp.]|nr:diaminopimelate epimerase [Blautia sp.]
MKFTKMHGIGNDYVYVNCFEETVADAPAAARFVSDRHFGIGSDGLILICPADDADCEMVMYNADGSRGAMCGNGIRCVAKYAYDHGIVNRETITVKTGSGIKTLHLTISGGKVQSVRVNMGSPVLEPAKIPVLSEKDRIINEPLEAGSYRYRFTAVSMGNPHAVIFTEGIDGMDLEKMGPYFENHPLFPDRINTEFVEKAGHNELKMRVWERGSGETLACGTGACAVAVAAVLNGLASAEEPVTVHLRGGDLSIFWDQKDNNVYMTGPAATVFEGEIDLDEILQGLNPS